MCSSFVPPERPGGQTGAVARAPGTASTVHGLPRGARPTQACDAAIQAAWLVPSAERRALEAFTGDANPMLSATGSLVPGNQRSAVSASDGPR